MPSESVPVIHPARLMPYGELLAGLQAARAAGAVYSRTDESGRTLWCYTGRCVYERLWDRFTVLARGLVTDEVRGGLVATPFPKFWNLGENGMAVPPGEFESFEKVDGSLSVIHHHRGSWRACTKGSLDSAQAVWTESRLAATDTRALVPGATYLAEAVYPENRMVVRYAEAGLVLLGGYDPQGREFGGDEVSAIADTVGWRAAGRYRHASLEALLTEVDTLPRSAEGFVLRWPDGTRLKVKGAEYRRIHALIARCTPLDVWRVMEAGDDLEAIRRDLPEEFLGDFDGIVGALEMAMAGLREEVASTAAAVAHLSDRDLAACLGEQPERVRPFLLAWRKAGGSFAGRSLKNAWRAVRPERNVLPGYVPSYSMGRIATED